MRPFPAFDVTVTADRYTGTPGTTFTLTAASVSASGPVRYEWQLPDGSRREGATCTVQLQEPGTFVSSVTATDAKGETVESGIASTIFPAQGRPATGLLGVPRSQRPGDVDDNGSVSLEDVLRCARIATRSDRERDAAEVLRADPDLDGRITEADVAWIAGAVDGNAAAPDRLVPSRGAAGCIVRVTAAALLDPAATFTVRVGDGPRVLLDRVELGFGAWVVPPSLAAGPTTVHLESDAGGEVAFDFEVLAPYESTEPPGALFTRLMELENRGLPLARRGLIAYLDAIGVAPEQRAAMVAVWDLAQTQVAREQANLLAVMNDIPRELMIALEQAAVANGMLEQIHAGERLLGPADGRNLLLTDDALSVLCWLSVYKSSALNTAAGWASTACDYVGTGAAAILAAIAAGFAWTGAIPAVAVTALTAIVSTCTAIAAPTAVAEVVAEVAPDMDLAQLRLAADPAVLSPPSSMQSQLRVSLSVPVDPSLCAAGGGIAEWISKKAVEKMLKKVPLLRGIWLFLKIVPKKVRDQLEGAIVDVVAGAVGVALDASGAAARLQSVGHYICELGAAYGATLDPNGVLTGPDPGVGTLVLAPPGTELPSVYTGDATQPTTVTFTAAKSICGNALVATVQVSYGIRAVGITMGDNGNLNDDIFAVDVAGQTVLTSQAPTRAVSTSVDLALGRHTVIMRGLAAPDGIGTYYIRFSSATVLPGSDPLSGTDLVPNTSKTFHIEVQ